MSRRTKRLLKLRERIIEIKIRQNLRFMEHHAARQRKIEKEIELIIAENRKLYSDLESVRKEILENDN